MLRSIRDVLREIKQRQGQFQHVDWSKLFTKDPRTNYLQFFNRIVTDFELVKKSTDLGELQKIRDQWRDRDNETFNNGTFNDRAIAIRRKIRDERTGRETTGKAPKVSPPPMKKTAMEKAAQQTGAPTFGYPDIRFPDHATSGFDEDLDKALDALERARFSERREDLMLSGGGKVLQIMPDDYELTLNALNEAGFLLNEHAQEFKDLFLIERYIADLMNIAIDLINFYAMQKNINGGKRPNAEAQGYLNKIQAKRGNLSVYSLNALITSTVQHINDEKAARRAPGAT